MKNEQWWGPRAIFKTPGGGRLRTKLAGLAVALLAGLAACGCGGPLQKSSGPSLQEVEVGLPSIQPVVDYEDFTGRTEAVPSVDVRARVSGYLQYLADKDSFKEGFDVKEGDPLFLIDPRTYQADYDRAAANLCKPRPA